MNDYVILKRVLGIYFFSMLESFATDDICILFLIQFPGRRYFATVLIFEYSRVGKFQGGHVNLPRRIMFV